MRSFRMSWFLTIIVLSFAFNNLSEAKHEKNLLPSAVVVGTVYCDTCFQEEFSKTRHFISGALVAVECGGTSSKQSFREEVKTNEHGEFKVHLPFLVSKHVKKMKGCSVKLLRSSEPYCAVPSTTTSSLLHLKSREQGTHIFSAGFFTFKPLKQPTLCNQKPSVQNSKQFSSKKSLTPTLDDPTFPPSKTSKFSNGMVTQQKFFSPIPPIPLLPSPPPVLGIPLPPNPLQPPSVLPPNPLLPPPSVLPPNPLQPPPSILPPNPLQPPPSIFPPIPFQPSPPPLINLPPIIPGLPPIIPGLTPSPPPPTFPIPLPPLPFVPPPGFPGIPPASSSKKASP